MHIITITNQKGGVGKTTTTLNLAHAFAARGLAVLMADNDHQRSLTRIVLGDDAARSLAPGDTIVGAYAGSAAVKALARPSGLAGIDLLAGHVDVETVNVPSPWDLPRARQAMLAVALRRRPAHDVVLIDCHPDLQFCTWAAMAAADAMLIPATPDPLGVHGIVEDLEAIDAAVARVNPGLSLVGILINRFDPREKIAREFVAGLRAAYGPRVLATEVHSLVAYKEAIAARRPIGALRPRDRAAWAIDEVADELLARLAPAGKEAARA